MNKPVFFIFGFLILANIFSWSMFGSVKNNYFLDINFFDVGQGDFSFIHTHNKKIVIDGGPDYNAAVGKISKIIPFWDREIDLVIITHPEDDHFGGLFEILKRYEIKNIIWSGEEKPGEKFKNFKIAVAEEQKQGCVVSEARAGDRIILGDSIMEVLSPFGISGNSNEDSTNSSSLVVKLSYGSNSFLFTGDISSENEKEIINNGKNIKADVLKVAHHGSKYSTSKHFLENSQPKVAVIQVGKNTYGHPSKETLENLASYNVKTLRNDVNGDIEITSDGKNLKISVDKIVQ
jgi:competence protein ComEC